MAVSAGARSNVAMAAAPAGRKALRSFHHEPSPTHVVFGYGARQQLADEIARLGASRVLVLCTPGRRTQAEDLSARLGAAAAGLFAEARMHVPIETATNARTVAQRVAADGIVAIGGGSTVGLAKAIALTTGLPIVAVPTTYSGSEMTPIYGITEADGKKTGRDGRVVPRVAIYDPDLTLGLSRHTTAVSGMNAVAHCVEALYAPEHNPVVVLMAEEGLRSLAGGLQRLAAAPEDREARYDTFYGAWLAGSVLSAAGMALHHKLCHVLGGSFGLPHAETHAAVLPHVIAYNAPAAPEAMARIVNTFGDNSAASAVFEFARRLGVEMALCRLGLEPDALEAVANAAVASPYYNPRPVDRDGIRALLQRAFDGEPPR